jgi:hypothetical protein
MKINDLSDYKHDEIQALLRRVPFFKELQEKDPQQTQVLLHYSCMVELEPGETIMRRGDRGSWMYFLVKGQLAVYLDEPESGKALNQITPGELFGDLALLCDHERKATVAAEFGNKKALLFATDFKPFGDLKEFATIKLSTKLTFYRTMVHSIRWRLEVKRMAAPSHPLAKELLKHPTFAGPKDSVEELESLYELAEYLADILDRWNSEGAQMQDIFVANALQG